MIPRRLLFLVSFALCVLVLWGLWARPTLAQTDGRPITTSADGASDVFAADVDGDGDTDVLSASQNDDTIAWYENDGAESFTRRIVTTTADAASSVSAADLDGDGDTDILAAAFNDDEVVWYENDGAESFTKRVITASAGAPSSVTTADLDGDGDPDVLSASQSADTVTWYENDGTGTFTSRVITTTADAASSVTTADVDGDGDLDVLSASFNDDTVAWYENDGTASFTKRIVSSDVARAFDVDAADLDGDGDTDVLSASQGDDTIAWHENDGTESFTTRVITGTAEAATSVATADLDSDGDTDVVSASFSDDTVAWYANDGTGTFSARTLTTAADGAFRVVVADVDSDGLPDILSASQNDDTIAWYDNTRLRRTSPIARTDTIAVTEDTVRRVSAPGVLANDSDPDGEPLSASLLTEPNRGTVVLDANGALAYTPDANVFGTDSLTYTATDGTTPDTATVVVSIAPVNDAPSITLAGDLSVTDPALADREQVVSSFAIDFDPGPNEDNQSLLDVLVREVQDTAQVVRNVDVDNNGTLRYTPADSARGTAVIGVQARDNGGTVNGGVDTSRTQTFRIAVDTRPAITTPVARADTFATAEDTTLTVDAPGVLANDTDPNDDALTASVVDGPERGTLTLDASGGFTYTPAPDSFGTDAFTYTASDGQHRDTARVLLSVGPVNDPPTVTLTSPESDAEVTQDETVSLAATAADMEGPVDRVAFLVNGTPIGTDTDGSDGFATTWTPTTVGSASVAAVATDTSGATGRSDTLAVAVRAVTLRTTPTRVFPNPDDRTNFRLVALPGPSGTRMGETVTGSRPNEWRAFREGGRSGTEAFQRLECTANRQCRFWPGSGYWLIARQSWDISLQTEVVPLVPRSSGPGFAFQIDLQDGWNVISNPLEIDVPWSAVQAASGTTQPLWRWNGRWQQVSTFTSATGGEAYYFMDDGLDALTIPFETSDSAAPAARTERDAASTLALHVAQDDRTASTVRVGLHPESGRGLDTWDRYGPPGYFGPATLRSIHRDGGRRYELATEYRPPPSEGTAFDLELQATPGTPVTLRASGLRTWTGRPSVVLVQTATGQTFDLRADSTVTLTPTEPVTRFRLLVGDADYVDEAHEAVRPEQAALQPPYPNPFRAATTIEYALPAAQPARVAVYDVLGRRVAVLHDGQQSAGFHHVQWRGRDAQGGPVASGVYLVRLETGTTVDTRRVVLVR